MEGLDKISSLLVSKSKSKSLIFRQTKGLFDAIEKRSIELVKELEKRADSDELSFSVERKGEFEIQVKIAGDLIVFLMHSNVVTLPDNHGYIQTDYVSQQPLRRYLGQINVYNFMADSYKYNRVHDSGYLIARIMMNVEERYFVEGEQLRYRYANLSQDKFTDAELDELLTILFRVSIETDLVATPISSIRQIQMGELQSMSAKAGTGQKIGFQMMGSEN